MSDDNPDRLSVWIDRYLESIRHSREKRFHYLEFLRFSRDDPASGITETMVNWYLDSKRKTVKDISLKSKVQRLAEWMEENVPEGLTVFELPAHHRRRLEPRTCSNHGTGRATHKSRDALPERGFRPAARNGLRLGGE